MELLMKEVGMNFNAWTVSPVSKNMYIINLSTCIYLLFLDIVCFRINKKIPRGPPSPPAPVMHSPTRKVSYKLLTFIT